MYLNRKKKLKKKIKYLMQVFQTKFIKEIIVQKFIKVSNV